MAYVSATQIVNKDGWPWPCDYNLSLGLGVGLCLAFSLGRVQPVLHRGPFTPLRPVFVNTGTDILGSAFSWTRPLSPIGLLVESLLARPHKVRNKVCNVTHRHTHQHTHNPYRMNQTVMVGLGETPTRGKKPTLHFVWLCTRAVYMVYRTYLAYLTCT